MKNILGLAMIPLICMGVTILTALVIIFALRRGTRAINAQAQDMITEKRQEPNADTRWARADLQGEAHEISKPAPTVTCPACGGENSTGSSSCAFCGRQLLA